MKNIIILVMHLIHLVIGNVPLMNERITKDNSTVVLD